MLEGRGFPELPEGSLYEVNPLGTAGSLGAPETARSLPRREVPHPPEAARPGPRRSPWERPPTRATGLGREGGSDRTEARPMACTKAQGRTGRRLFLATATGRRILAGDRPLPHRRTNARAVRVGCATIGSNELRLRLSPTGAPARSTFPLSGRFGAAALPRCGAATGVGRGPAGADRCGIRRLQETGRPVGIPDGATPPAGGRLLKDDRL